MNNTIKNTTKPFSLLNLKCLIYLVVELSTDCHGELNRIHLRNKGPPNPVERTRQYNVFATNSAQLPQEPMRRESEKVAKAGPQYNGTVRFRYGRPYWHMSKVIGRAPIRTSFRI